MGWRPTYWTGGANTTPINHTDERCPDTIKTLEPYRSSKLMVLQNVTSHWGPPAWSFSDVSSYWNSPKPNPQHISIHLNHPFSEAQGLLLCVINTRSLVSVANTYFEAHKGFEQQQFTTASILLYGKLPHLWLMMPPFNPLEDSLVLITSDMTF